MLKLMYSIWSMVVRAYRAFVVIQPRENNKPGLKFIWFPFKPVYRQEF